MHLILKNHSNEKFLVKYNVKKNFSIKKYIKKYQKDFESNSNGYIVLSLNSFNARRHSTSHKLSDYYLINDLNLFNYINKYNLNTEKLKLLETIY